MKLILTCFLLLVGAFSYAQNVQFNFGGQITNYETGKKEAGVTVSVIANGVKVATSKTASNGKYVLNFDLNAKAKYDIVFSKPGFVTKRVSFDLTDLDTQKVKEGQKISPVQDLSMELFTVKPGIDFSFLDREPVASFTADGSNVKYDVSANQRMKQKIESLLDNSGNAVDDTDVKYNAAIQAGEKLFKEQKLEEALKQFEAAAFLKPKEFLPQKRIAEIDQLLRAKKEESYAVSETDQQYNNYIKAADNFRDNKQYTEAISKYRAAMRVKNEQYPKDEVAKIEKIVNDLAAAERTEREYQEALTAGDAAMSSKQYETAVQEYNKAIALRENEKYPKDQLALAQEELKSLANAKAKQENYDALMKEANNSFGGSKFEEAKAKYQEALTVFPNESIPKEKIKLCDEQIAKLADAKKQEEEINKLFEQGQALIDKKDYAPAKEAYKKILKLDPKNNLAFIKIDDIDRLIKEDEDAKNAEARFAKYVKQGDAAVLSDDFTMAKQHYGAALEIRDDAVVKEKFDAVLSKLANQEAKALVASKYEEVMQEAKTLLDNNELEKARLKYQNAASIDDTQNEPKTRIAEIDARLNKNAAEDKKYREWIDKGDALVTSRDYLEAIKMFDKASKMRPSEQEPRDKSKNAARLSRESEDDANALFEKMISAAESKIDESDYAKARDLANRAINLRPAEKRPEDRRPEEMLTRIDNLEKTEKAYNELITAAESEASAKEYRKAIGTFKKAGELRPKEELPPKRIKELSELYNSLQNSAEMEKKYQENFSKGVSEMSIKSYKLALASFETAQTYKPEDQVVQDKISEVKQILEEQKNALANEAERKLRVEELVIEANILFEKRDWSQAKNKYNEVIGMDPDQPFSLARIAECDQRLQEEMNKVAEAEYLELISNADNNFEKKDFLRSKELFEKANSIRPKDNYPVERLADIERLLNPTIVQSTSLEPLGDVYTGEDADLALAKGEIARKNKKSDEFLRTKNSTIQQMDEQSAKQQAKTYQAQADLNAVEAKTAELQSEATQRAHDLTEQVKLVKYKANASMDENAEYEKAQNLADQEKLNYIQVDLDEQKEKADYNAQLKAAQMSQQTSEMMVADSDRSQKYDKNSIYKAKQLSTVSIEAQESMSDEESRRLTELQIKLANEKALNASSDLAEDQEAKAQHNVDRFREIDAINESQAEENAATIETRVNDIRAIEMENLEMASNANALQTEKQQEIKEGINIQVKVEERRSAENAEELQAKQVQLSSIKSSVELKNQALATTDKDREVHVQSNLDYIIITNQEKQQEESKKQNENAAVIKEVKNSAEDINTEIVLNKQEKTYASQETIDQVKISGEEYAQETTEKQEKNAATIDDLYALEAIKNQDLSDKARESQQAMKDKIDDVETAPKKEVAKNSLGMDFPEGVTEEQFTRSGSDGIIHTVITRRVVVIDGHGDVYVRTRRNGMTTYTKNNASITEYTWQKETQGSNLVRH